MIINNFKKRLKNANAVIAQLKAGEWEFKYNPISKDCITAHRNGRELWVGNGGFSCDVDESNAFGYLLRHYVWWKAAIWETRKANKEHPREIPTLYDE